MKLMQFTAHGVSKDIESITINLDNVTSIYPVGEENKRNFGNTKIHYVNGSFSCLQEPYEEVIDAIRKAHG